MKKDNQNIDQEDIRLKKIRYYQGSIKDYEDFWNDKIEQSKSDTSTETKACKEKNDKLNDAFKIVPVTEGVFSDILKRDNGDALRTEDVNSLDRKQLAEFIKGKYPEYFRDTDISYIAVGKAELFLAFLKYYREQYRMIKICNKPKFSKLCPKTYNKIVERYKIGNGLDADALYFSQKDDNVPNKMFLDIIDSIIKELN